jgi:hypothetical protein
LTGHLFDYLVGHGLKGLRGLVNPGHRIIIAFHLVFGSRVTSRRYFIFYKTETDRISIARDLRKGSGNNEKE